MTYVFNKALVSPVHQVTTHTSTQSSSDSPVTRITLDGSTLSYTPHPDAQKVVYEIGFSAHRLNDWTFQTVILQVSTDGGSSWTDTGGRTLSTFGHSGSTTQSYRWFYHRRYVINAYTGARSYRIQIGTYNHGRQCQYGGLSEWDGGSTSTVFTNTSLIMHSLL